MCVAYGNGQRVGFIFAYFACFGQQSSDHHPHLIFIGMTCADYRFLYKISCILANY